MKLKRNSLLVKEKCVEKNNKLFTKEACKIHIPKRYIKRNLAQFADTNYIYGIFALIYDNQYTVCNINALIKINPDKIESIKVNDVEYYEISFKENSIIIDNMDLVKQELLIFNVFDEMVFKGKIPWYIEYNDLGKIFDTADLHGGSNVNKNLAVIEFLASILARDSKDPTKLYRLIVDSYSKLKSDPPHFVSLSNIYYSVAGTMNKIAGSYYDEGVVSALVTPTEEVSKIEKILRT